MTQSSSNVDLINCYWQRTNDTKDYSIGCITTYYLHQLLERGNKVVTDVTYCALDEFKLNTQHAPDFQVSPQMVSVDCLLFLFYLIFDIT